MSTESNFSMYTSSMLNATVACTVISLSFQQPSAHQKLFHLELDHASCRSDARFDRCDRDPLADSSLSTSSSTYMRSMLSVGTSSPSLFCLLPCALRALGLPCYTAWTPVVDKDVRNHVPSFSPDSSSPFTVTASRLSSDAPSNSWPATTSADAHTPLPQRNPCLRNISPSTWNQCSKEKVHAVGSRLPSLSEMWHLPMRPPQACSVSFIVSASVHIRAKHATHNNTCFVACCASIPSTALCLTIITPFRLKVVTFPESHDVPSEVSTVFSILVALEVNHVQLQTTDGQQEEPPGVFSMAWFLLCARDAGLDSCTRENPSKLRVWHGIFC